MPYNWGTLFFIIKEVKEIKPMNVEYDLVIDFARPSKSNTIIISEGDSNSRMCRFVLLSNKQSFDMLDVSTATVKGIKSDGSVIYGDGTIVKDDDGNNINEVLYTLPAAVSDISGKTTMTITLMSVRGEVITSFEFYVQTRNSLYSEDDYISDSDLSGFRDLLNRSNAALEKMEQMTQKEALPNPYPINITTNKEEYHYNGSETVDVALGDIAYLAEDPHYEVNPVDETAAGIAVAAASEAQIYAESARNSANVANTAKVEVTGMAIDVAAQVSEASESAINAGKSAQVAEEAKTEVKAVQTNINKTIENKVTTITNQLAGEMIDGIIDEAKGYKDAAASSATMSKNEADRAKSEADRAKSAADYNPTLTTTTTLTDSANGNIRSIKLEGYSYKSKNLLDNKSNSKTLNNVVFTVNDDKSITVNGTASATTVFVVKNYKFEVGTYKLIGCPQGGAESSKYKLDVLLSGGSSADIGNGKTFNITTVGSFDVRIVVYSGTVCNNLVFKPMITTDTSVTYADYEPYGIIAPSGDITTHNADNTLSSTTHTDRPLLSVNDIKNELIVNADGSGTFVERVGSVDLSKKTWDSASSGFVCRELRGIAKPLAQCIFSENYSYSTTTWTPNCFGITSNMDLWVADTNYNKKGTLVFEIATPITYQLSSTEVAELLSLKTFSGTTYIDTDNAPFEVSYFTNTELAQSIASVDSKVDDVASEIKDYVDLGYLDGLFNEWQQGTLASGVENNATTRLRTPFIEMPTNNTLYIDLPSGNKYAYHLFNANKVYISHVDWITTNNKVVITNDNAKYIRFVLSKTDDSNITPNMGTTIRIAPSNTELQSELTPQKATLTATNGNVTINRYTAEKRNGVLRFNARITVSASIDGTTTAQFSESCKDTDGVAYCNASTYNATPKNVCCRVQNKSLHLFVNGSTSVPAGEYWVNGEFSC